MYGESREQVEGISVILMILSLLQSNGRSLKDCKRGEMWSGVHFKQLPRPLLGNELKDQEYICRNQLGLTCLGEREDRNVTPMLAMEMRIHGYMQEIFMGYLFRVQ